MALLLEKKFKYRIPLIETHIKSWKWGQKNNILVWIIKVIRSYIQ